MSHKLHISPYKQKLTSRDMHLHNTQRCGKDRADGPLRESREIWKTLTGTSPDLPEPCISV